MDDGIDRYLRINRSTIALGEKTNGVIVEWSLGYFLNVGDCKSVGVSRCFGEMRASKISYVAHVAVARQQ